MNLFKRVKAKAKKIKKIPLIRPEGWGPDTVKGLKWERRELLRIAEVFSKPHDSAIGGNTDPKSPRRVAVKRLLKLCLYPGRTEINSQILWAVLCILKYEDIVAHSILKDLADRFWVSQIHYLKKALQIVAQKNAKEGKIK